MKKLVFWIVVAVIFGIIIWFFWSENPVSQFERSQKPKDNLITPVERVYPEWEGKG